jgi:hypothetical protein
MRIAALILALAAATVAVAAKPLVWKTATNAFLRVNDQPVKEWDVFQIEKKNDRFLLLLGERFLLIEAQQKQVFEIAPATVEHSGPDLLWDPADRPQKPLATSVWIVRNIGEAQRIKFQLDAEDHTIDLQIPHPPSRY